MGTDTHGDEEGQQSLYPDAYQLLVHAEQNLMSEDPKLEICVYATVSCEIVPRKRTVWDKCSG